MIITFPIAIPDHKKPFRMNLNTYRNTNTHALNRVKKTFKLLVKNQVLKLPQMKEVELHYTVWFTNKAARDISNFCAVADKFFSDCLTEYNIIPDDNFNHIKRISYNFGGIEKGNERFEVEICEVNSQQF